VDLISYIRQSVDIKGRPLSQSSSKDRINIHETEQTLHRKLSGCANLPSSDDNPFRDLLEYSVLPFKSVLGVDNIPFNSGEELAELISANKLTLPDDLELVQGWLQKKLEYINSFYNKVEESKILDWIDFSRLYHVK